MESDETVTYDNDTVAFERKIGSLRDEITAYLMHTYRGNNRNIALALTKLDEAKLWMTQHGLDTGRLLVVNRADMLKAAKELDHV